jgi:hypothetical protein
LSVRRTEKSVHISGFDVAKASKSVFVEPVSGRYSILEANSLLNFNSIASRLDPPTDTSWIELLLSQRAFSKTLIGDKL